MKVNCHLSVSDNVKVEDVFLELEIRTHWYEPVISLYRSDEVVINSIILDWVPALARAPVTFITNSVDSESLS